jgi:hypothetical protein
MRNRYAREALTIRDTNHIGKNFKTLQLMEQKGYVYTDGFVYALELSERFEDGACAITAGNSDTGPVGAYHSAPKTNFGPIQKKKDGARVSGFVCKVLVSARLLCNCAIGAWWCIGVAGWKDGLMLVERAYFALNLHPQTP